VVRLLFDSEKHTTRDINSHNSHLTSFQNGDYESGSLFELMSRVVCSVSNKSEITIISCLQSGALEIFRLGNGALFKILGADTRNFQRSGPVRNLSELFKIRRKSIHWYPVRVIHMTFEINYLPSLRINITFGHKQ
jgi:hypothetical protein